MNFRAAKAKKLKITCGTLRLRNGLKAPATALTVYYNEETVGLPWREIRPLVAHAFRHVQREAFHTHKEEFIRRERTNTSVLNLVNSKSCWWGHSFGVECRVMIGKLHETPQKDTYRAYKDMPVYWYRDWHEHLLHLIAHELWHRWQPGSGRDAEIMCELVGIDAVEAYRKKEEYTFTPPEDALTVAHDHDTGDDPAFGTAHSGEEDARHLPSPEPSGAVPAHHRAGRE